MTATALRTKSETPPVFPSRPAERQKLAEAISRKAAAKKRLSDINAALERSSSTPTFLALKTARSALEDAKAGDQHDYLLAVALGEAAAGDDPVKSAAAEVTKCEAAYETAKRTEAALRTEAETAQRELSMAEFDLRAALRAVVEVDAATEQLIERYRKHAELNTSMRARR